MKAIGLNVIIDVTEYFESLNPKETKTESGLIIPAGAANPDKDKEKVILGKIISVSKRASEKTDLKEGDEVFVSKFFGNKHEEDDKTYAIMAYDLILAKKE
jgi:co-chaperonin GroES (HSP10)